MMFLCCIFWLLSLFASIRALEGEYGDLSFPAESPVELEPRDAQQAGSDTTPFTPTKPFFCVSQRCLVSPQAPNLRNQNCCLGTVCNGTANEAGVVVGICSPCVAAGNACMAPGDCCGLNVCMNIQIIGGGRRGVCGRPFTPLTSSLIPSTSLPLSTPLPVPSSIISSPSLPPLISSTTTSTSSSSVMSTTPPPSSSSTSTSTTSTSTGPVNLFLNPGFELYSNTWDPWTITDSDPPATITYGLNNAFPSPTVTAHSGTNCLVWQQKSAYLPYPTMAINQPLSLTAGSTYQFQVWIQTALSGQSAYDVRTVPFVFVLFYPYGPNGVQNVWTLVEANVSWAPFPYQYTYSATGGTPNPYIAVSFDTYYGQPALLQAAFDDWTAYKIA